MYTVCVRLPVQKCVLRFQVVDHKGLPQFGVFNGLVQGKPRREEAYQDVHDRPFFYRLVQNHVLIKDHGLHLHEFLQSSQDLMHRLGVGFLLHGTDPQYNFLTPGEFLKQVLALREDMVDKTWIKCVKHVCNKTWDFIHFSLPMYNWLP